MDRRLAAILVADVAGYSALVGADEDGTIRAWKGHLAALEPVIALHGGRIVKTIGDGILAEFSSVIDAVSAAALMQARMAERNTGIPAGRRIELRMGIHVGDVVVDGDDILGDGVNIAARLQTIASPGGLAVSGRVFDDVAGRLELAFEDLGPQAFRNTARPVPGYALAAHAPARPRETIALPDKPSVAVLPFTNMSADPDQDYFADGIAEDIITGLSYVPWLFVIARNSSFTYKGLAVDIREIGRQLGVRYVLEGSVRRAGERLRVTGQLIDAGTGGHLWSGRYDGSAAEVFELQDRITADVIAAIAPGIRNAEIARAARKRPESLDAYDHYLQALAAIHRARIDDADAHLDQAIDRAPGFAKARALKAWCGTLFPWIGRSVDAAEFARRADLAEAVLDSLDTDPEDEAYAGYCLAFCGRDYGRGQRLVEQATERAPSFAWAWASSAMLRAYRGDSEPAIERAHRALRLSPYDPMAFRTHLALSFAYLAAGDFERMLEQTRLGLELNPRALLIIRHQAVALAHLGRIDEAQAVARRYASQAPKFQTSLYSSTLRHLLSDQVRQAMIEGLRLSGMAD